MAGAMRKMAVYLGLVEEDADHYDDGYDEGYDDGPEAYEPERPRERVVRLPERTAVTAAHAAPAGHVPAGHVPAGQVPATVVHAPGATPVFVPEPEEAVPYRITTVHPRNYNEAREIGERFREGVSVVMNVTDMGDSDAKRLVDFAAGLTFGLSGSIERVTSKVFLLTPATVEVTAETKARIAEGGFFNQS